MVEHKKVNSERRKKLNKQYGSWIQVNRTRYHIVYCEEIYGEESGKYYGRCDIQDRKIYVVDDNELEETLLHEVIHAELFEAGFYFNPAWDNNLEEHVCEAISKGFVHNWEFRRRAKRK